MYHTYHVLTPLNRYENLRGLIQMLEPMKVEWELITDKSTPFRVSFDQPWIHHHVYEDPPGGEFWRRCNMALNWYLDSNELVDDHRYCFLNDDDGYEPDFFNKIDLAGGEVVVTAMKRGNQIPKGVHPDRAHDTFTLLPSPENCKPGKIGVEQMIVSGRILKKCRLPMHIMGDGMMLEHIAVHNPIVCVPEAEVWFNYFEPGRWDK